VKEDYVNAFLAPAKLVWEKELNHTLDFIGAEAVSHRFTTEDITAVVGVSGQLEGNVLYGFSQGTGLAIVGCMMGDPVLEFDEIALSALGEIANMITGNAATQLAALGYMCDISPPVIIESVGNAMTTLRGTQIMAKFASDLGNLDIRVSLNERAIRD